MSAKALMGKIRQAETPRAIIDIITVHGGDFDEIHSATCLYEIAQMRRMLSKAEAESPVLRDLVEFLAWQTSQMNPYALANTAWSVAQLRRQMGQVVLKLVPSIAEQSALTIGKFNARELANLAWALATVRHRDAGLFQKIAGAFAKKNRDAEAQNLSNMAWSYATLGVLNAELMAAIAAQASRIISDLRGQHLANLAWSFAKLGILDEGLMDAIADRSVEIMHTFNSQMVSNLAWSFAKLGFRHEGVMGAIASRTADIIDTFSSQALANTAWSVAKLRVGSSTLMGAIADQTRATAHMLDAQGLGNIAWAFWRSGVRNCAVAQCLCSSMSHVSKEALRDSDVVMNWAMTMSLAADAGVAEEPLIRACAESLAKPGRLNKASDYGIGALMRLAETEGWSATAPGLCAALARQVKKRGISRVALESDLIKDPQEWAATFL